MTKSLRQMLVGLMALPLSIVPFVAYATYTPEGRLIRDRALLALSRPVLPTLRSEEMAQIRRHAPRYHDAVAALVYHGLGSTSDGEGGFVVSPRRFGQHLVALRAAGMHAVTARQVARAMAGREALPANAVMISFDDGRADAMMFADPLLEQAGFRATMFVITNAADRPGVYYASWGRLRSAARSGRWDLESHTAGLHFERSIAGGGSLPALTSVAPHESIDRYRLRVRRDLSQASAAIARASGARPVAFAYPFGAYGADRTNDPRIRSVLREEVARQYDVAFDQDEQADIRLVAERDPRLDLRRIEVGNWTPQELLGRIGAAAQRSRVPASAALDVGPVLPVGEPAPPAPPDPPVAPAAGIDEALDRVLRVDPLVPTLPGVARRALIPPSTTTTTITVPLVPVPSSTTTTTTPGPTTTSPPPGPLLPIGQTPTTTIPRPPATTTTTIAGPPKTTTTTTTTTVARPPTTTTTAPTTTTTTIAPCRGSGRCRSGV